MLRDDRPRWDVRGHMVMCRAGMADTFEYRLRCYSDGHGLIDVDGIVYPIPATMTAFEYFEVIFLSRFGGPIEAPNEALIAGD